MKRRAKTKLLVLLLYRMTKNPLFTKIRWGHFPCGPGKHKMFSIILNFPSAVLVSKIWAQPQQPKFLRFSSLLQIVLHTPHLAPIPMFYMFSHPPPWSCNSVAMLPSSDNIPAIKGRKLKMVHKLKCIKKTKIVVFLSTKGLIN